MRSQVQKGFTLIELMIVVAIVAILAAIAIPQYQNFTARAQVSEGISLASGLETKIADYYNGSGGSMPASITDINGASAKAADVNGKYVTSVAVANGALTITYGGAVSSALSAKTLGITPYTNTNGDLVWICGSASTTGLTLPTGTTAASTDVPTQYLPKSCQ